MSLTSIETAARAERFPRASGDEPVADDIASSRPTFSPRERG